MRQHVSRAEIIKLENGQLVTLNQAQLDELRKFAPEWVRVTAVPDGTFFTVAIDDTRSTTLTGAITKARDAWGREIEEF